MSALPPAPTPNEQRARGVVIVLVGTLVANWAVAGIKLALGLAAESSSLTSDGLHSFIDGASNIVGLIAMRSAMQPADTEHPYGHSKFEALASLAIGIMIGAGVLELGRMAFDAIAHGVHPHVETATIIAVVGTLATNIVVTTIEKRQGQKLRSAILLADAEHTRSDVLVSLAVLSSLVLVKLGYGAADGWVALAVLGFVSFTAWSIVRRALGVLADSAKLDPKAVAAQCVSLPDVLDVRRVRSRGLDNAVHVDLIIDVNAQLTVERAHAAADAVERTITAAFPEVVDVVVHVEPKTA